MVSGHILSALLGTAEGKDIVVYLGLFLNSCLSRLMVHRTTLDFLRALNCVSSIHHGRNVVLHKLCSHWWTWWSAHTKSTTRGSSRFGTRFARRVRALLRVMEQHAEPGFNPELLTLMFRGLIQ